MGDALESYIHYRKLKRCKVLSNFVEYRNKVYKREKISPKTNIKQSTTKIIPVQNTSLIKSKVY